eukprot:14886536-Alexandrium_andersonii.AAC.1
MRTRIAVHMPDCGLCREYEMFLKHYEILRPGTTLIPRVDTIEEWPDEDRWELKDFLAHILAAGVPHLVKIGVAFVREDPDFVPPHLLSDPLEAATGARAPSRAWSLNSREVSTGQGPRALDDHDQRMTCNQIHPPSPFPHRAHTIPVTTPCPHIYTRYCPSPDIRTHLSTRPEPLTYGPLPRCPGTHCSVHALIRPHPDVLDPACEYLAHCDD